MTPQMGAPGAPVRGHAARAPPTSAGTFLVLLRAVGVVWWKAMCLSHISWALVLPAGLVLLCVLLVVATHQASTEDEDVNDTELWT